MDYDYRIQQAKKRLPLPKLMELLGDKWAARKSALCPFHNDENPSFSVWQDARGVWRWNCFATCGQGDEIEYLAKKLDVGRGAAIREYLQLAGLWRD